LDTNPFLTGLPHPHPDLLAPKDLDLTTGTAEILRLPEVRKVLTSDFLVLPCDLVCELGGENLLQAWMVRATAPYAEPPQPSGGLGVWYETKTTTPIKGEETDFIATTPLAQPTVPTSKDSLLFHLSALALSMPTDSLKDLTEEKQGFPIRHGLLRKHPKLRMLTTHRDAHIYILPHWILDFISQNPRLETLGEDVIGWWAKSTWQDGLVEKLGLSHILKKSNGSTTGQSQDITSPFSDGESSPTTESHSPLGDSKNQRSLATSKAGGPKVPPVLAYLQPSDPNAPLIRRVDTAQLLLAVSLQLAKLPSVEEAGSEASVLAHSRKIAYPEGVKPRTTITKQDSLLADNVTVEEKTSVKECVIGANCQIKEGAKLFQCVLMDGVVVGKGCKLTRCILGKRSEIGEGSTLTDCEVQENLLVESRSKSCSFYRRRTLHFNHQLTHLVPAEDKENKFMSSEGLEATEEELQDALMNESDVDLMG
jgi:translation initiation factor eIF-2B subunit gamma